MMVAVAGVEDVRGEHTPPTAAYPGGHTTLVCSPAGEAVTPLGNSKDGKLRGNDDTVGAGGGAGVNP